MRIQRELLIQERLPGGFIEISGLHAQFPLDCHSKRHTATAHSTSEDELISAFKMLREHFIPLQRDVKSTLHEDNESTITVIKNGYSPPLRYLAKSHRIS